jgi:hypothetical protein
MYILFDYLGDRLIQSDEKYISEDSKLSIG